MTILAQQSAGTAQSYQPEAGQRDGREVDGGSPGDVDKASFQHGDGTQHMNPPVGKANTGRIQGKCRMVRVPCFY